MDIEALERLGRLRSSGAIGEDEFEAEKQRILGSTPGPAPHPAAPPFEAPILDHDYLTADSADRKPTGGILLIAAIAVIILGGGGFAAYRYFKAGSVISIGAAKYALRSHVKGIHIGSLKELSKNPHDDDKSCLPYERAAISSDAKMAKSAGWHITAEETVGNLTAISFVGACTAASGNSFKPIDGNVGLYDGDQLKAVVYGKKVARVARGDDPSKLNINNGKPDKITARIVVTAGSIDIKS